ncbi:flavin reductase family protein [Desmospora profundinema]|uniref:Flavin reductase (DIM6/NTAB) family NADH-FMN oxidoreductase RutF n=1 Tax=Desmospora profundinema TaxID=1571184 RepID=A0ABU1IH36_9BACL|nr:flavin reductase family protein [Desmospora profundinema]MDR6224090.1 flavin reductase (DIM6/NTAB) family NADH-FMN oxidoreductase RutF [Desmospora profundinema]
MERAIQHEITIIHPKILYYGTPVVLLSTLNEDDSTNISPLSSSWALGNVIVLGIGVNGKSLENLERHPECVVNLPHPPLWKHVEQLAPLTGKNPVPKEKKELGFQYEKDKFSACGLTPVSSLCVQPDRVGECPLQIEAVVKNIGVPEGAFFGIVELEGIQVHAFQEMVIDDNHINPSHWSPIIYNFRHYFALGEELGKTFRSTT